jgi:thiosulfate reductase cytochrome b subunit
MKFHASRLDFRQVEYVVDQGLAYLCYGIVSRRFRRKLFPISWHELIATMRDALTIRLKHDDLTHYNAVQKLLYIGIMLVGIVVVLSGLSIWKPVQFSELATPFYDFQTARLVHFLCMTAIVLFLVVHVTLTLLVPRSLVAMLTGGPTIKDEKAAAGTQPVSG